MVKVKRLVPFAALCAVSALAIAAPQKKVFVANLQAKNVEQSVAQALDTAVCNSASNDKRFDVVCPDMVKAMMEHAALTGMFGQGSSCEGDDCASLLAKRVKADLMIIGSVSKLEKNKFVLTLELVNTAEAKSLARVEEKVSGDASEVYKRAEGAVKKLLAQVK